MAKQKMVVLISARPKALVLLGEWLEKAGAEGKALVDAYHKK